MVIPARDEEEALPGVLASVPAFVDTVIVCDNGSADRTGAIAAATGALVVREERAGYGAACLAALKRAAALSPPPEIVVFADADGSDDLTEMEALIRPLTDGRADLVVGSRIKRAEPGALTPVQWFGNQFAGAVIRLVWGARVTDLGPFRALTWDALDRLDMRDRDFGWTVEMQIKAARRTMRMIEIAVAYRKRRGGRSKISQTLGGSIRAAAKILTVLAREAAARTR